jgi:hypothetical protein
MAQLFANNASALLPAAVAADDVTITLAPGEGERFPQPTEGDVNSFAILTLEDQNAAIEIVRMTERDGDLLTIVRGQEGTTPLGFAEGDRIELRMTAGGLQQFKQISDQWALRGGVINSDGQRYWHVTDPSSYQYFLQTYVTLGAFGLHLLRWQPPPGIDKIGYQFGVNGPQGELRAMQFAAGLTSGAPYPAQGEAALDVPGVFRMSSINNPFGSPVIYATWDTFFAADQGGIRVSRLKFEPDAVGDSTVNYHFITRNPEGKLRAVVFNGEGSIRCENRIELVNEQKEAHPSSDSIVYAHIPLPDNPEAGDMGYFHPAQGDRVARSLQYVFRVREIAGAGGPTPEITLRDFEFLKNGNFKVPGTPFADDDAATVGYVKASVSERTLLWSGAATSAAGDLDITGNVEDHQQILVTGTVGGGDFTFSVLLDAEQVIEGAGVTGPVYLLGMTGTHVYAGIRFILGWKFEVIDTAGDATVQRIVGIGSR